MNVFLEHFAQGTRGQVCTRSSLLDQAGWHDKRALQVLKTITLLPLLSASPALNPVERVWLYLA